MNDQRSLEDQLKTLAKLAIAAGLYDADDFLIGMRHEIAEIRKQNEQWKIALKHRCVCQFDDEQRPIGECHAHAVQRSGKNGINGDPVEWRSKPEQFKDWPHETPPVDLVRAQCEAAWQRLDRGREETGLRELLLCIVEAQNLLKPGGK